MRFFKRIHKETGAIYNEKKIRQAYFQKFTVFLFINK